MAKLSHKFFAIASLLTLALPVSPGAAQVNANPNGCICPSRGLCCQCADGRRLQVDISTGIAPWRVRTGTGPTQLAIVNPISPWTASLPPAAWITPPGSPEAAGDYVYELHYVVPDCVIPARFAITGQWAVDNSARISVDGGASFASVAGFNPPAIGSFSVPAAGLTPGAHTLTVVVNNSEGPTGLLIRAAITTLCPEQPETGSNPDVRGPVPDQPDILVAPLESPTPRQPPRGRPRQN